MAQSKNVKNMSLTNISLTPKEITEFISTCIDANQPVFLWGPPGVAKSALMRKVAKDKGMGLVDFRALMRDTVDLNGIPSASEDGKYTKWLRPNFFPELENTQFEDKGIFFIDELNAAPPSMQAVCYQIVHDRMSGEHELHPGWIPMGAGNYDTDGAVTTKMPTPLKSRFIHLNIGLTEEKDGVRHLQNQGQWCEEWLEWGRDEGNLHPLVIAYHRWTGGTDLYAFSKTTQTFPCLRTWEFVSNVLKTKPSSKLLFPLIAGCIGEGYAAKVYAFVQDALTLPDLDELLKKPMDVKVPEDAGRLYALVSALVAKMCQMDSKEFKVKFVGAMRFIERLQSDFQVLFVQDMFAGKKEDVSKHEETRKFAYGPVGALLMLAKQMDLS